MEYDITKPAALISVFYKDGIDRLAQAIHASGRTIYSTGGTAEHLIKIGIPIVEVSELTGFPEMMGGRLKTLHPMVFGPLLGRTYMDADMESMKEHRMPLIDIMVNNLYPFKAEVAKGITAENHPKIIEKIDVGGPSMIRAAAKNHERVIVICNPKDYDPLAMMLEKGEEVTLKQRERWAWEAFRTTSAYEATIEDYFYRRSLLRSGGHLD